jgi:hypothetical protein
MRTKQELLVMTNLQIYEFGTLLSTMEYLDMDKRDIQLIKTYICSDGCTGVADWYVEACIVHDFWYRTHRDFNGSPITKAEADKRFRRKIQKLSPAGFLSPMALWRWMGVKFLAGKAWDE